MLCRRRCLLNATIRSTAFDAAAGEARWQAHTVPSLPPTEHCSHTRCRHSASMLSALRGAAATTIARTMQDYRDMAVKLLQRPQALQRVQDSLKENWGTSPLFDIGRWVKDVEVRT